MVGVEFVAEGVEPLMEFGTGNEIRFWRLGHAGAIEAFFGNDGEAAENGSDDGSPGLDGGRSGCYFGKHNFNRR